jgi:transcriptional regulator with XRE-family HTH domain
MSFRDNLQQLRATRNMTQEQLAMLLGVSRQSVSKWEAEKAYPEMDKLLKICELFDCSLDELVKGDLTNRPTNATYAIPAHTTPQDVIGYDEHMRRFANQIAGGVALILLGVACAALLSNVNFLVDNNSSILVVIGLFTGIALGLALIIPSGMEHAAFVREHPFVEDFYTSEQKTVARRNLSRALVSGIACIFFGIIMAVVLQSFESLAGFIFLVLVASGVWLIVRFGILLSRINIKEYNDDALEEMDLDDIEDPKLRERARKKKRAGAVCGTIMLFATALGLALLFIPNPLTPYFWVVWPVGALLCGGVSTVMTSSDKEH